MDNSNSTIPRGYCQCGCGRIAPLSKQTDKRRGLKKGEPQWYVKGHKRPPDGRRYLPDGRKWCADCGEFKVPSDFYANKRAGDGHAGICKECSKARRYAYVEAHYEEVRLRAHKAYHENNGREKQREYQAQFSPEELERRQQQGRDSYARHAEKRREEQRQTRYKRYGITYEEYLEILEEQGGVCAICRKEFDLSDPRNVHIDHCHKEGHLRGILCRKCNLGISYFYDSPEMFRRVADYLTR